MSLLEDLLRDAVQQDASDIYIIAGMPATFRANGLIHQMGTRKLMPPDTQEILDTLTEREADVLRMRFGMYDGRTHTLEEVGQIFGVTRERIRQIENKAIRKLRHPSRAKRIRDFYC